MRDNKHLAKRIAKQKPLGKFNFAIGITGLMVNTKNSASRLLDSIFELEGRHVCHGC